MRLMLVAVLFFGLLNISFAMGDKSAVSEKTAQNPNMVMCTMDAKICPDGSYVGRTGPNCEFSPCPSEENTSLQQPANGERIAVTIMGSAETPDPILERAYVLEKQGLVKNIKVMESYPVQIYLEAPQHIIDELLEMPRIGLPMMY